MPGSVVTVVRADRRVDIEGLKARALTSREYCGNDESANSSSPKPHQVYNWEGRRLTRVRPGEAGRNRPWAVEVLVNNAGTPPTPPSISCAGPMDRYHTNLNSRSHDRPLWE